MTLGNTPVLILKEGSSVKKEAFEQNVNAIDSVAELIKTTFGPKGLEKMLFDRVGGSTAVSNDGAKILEELDVEHPAAKMVIELAKAQRENLGDGTTRSVLLTAALLNTALELNKSGLHQSMVAQGFLKAKNQALKILTELSQEISVDDNELLRKVALTALKGKNIGRNHERFAEMAVNSILQIKELRGDFTHIDLDDIQIVKKMGADMNATEFVNGLVIDKEVLHPMMPKVIKDAKIAILNSALEFQKTDFDAQIRIKDPDQIAGFKDEEAKILKKKVDLIMDAGANVVFCQKGIDEGAQRYLAQNNIFAVRRVKKSDIGRIARATGGNVITDIKLMTAEDLGAADKVSEAKYGQDRLIFVEGCSNAKSVSILIRGFKYAEEEAKAALETALNVTRVAVLDPLIIPGGGAIFIELRDRLETFAKTLPSKEQLVVEGYAAAIETLFNCLIENAGGDPMDLLPNVRAKHKEGGITYGVDLDTFELTDMLAEGVVEPTKITSQFLAAGSELALILLRVDQVINSK